MKIKTKAVHHILSSAEEVPQLLGLPEDTNSTDEVQVTAALHECVSCHTRAVINMLDAPACMVCSNSMELVEKSDEGVEVPESEVKELPVEINCTACATTFRGSEVFASLNGNNINCIVCSSLIPVKADDSFTDDETEEEDEDEDTSSIYSDPSDYGETVDEEDEGDFASDDDFDYEASDEDFSEDGEEEGVVDSNDFSDEEENEEDFTELASDEDGESEDDFDYEESEDNTEDDEDEPEDDSDHFEAYASANGKKRMSVKANSGGNNNENTDPNNKPQPNTDPNAPKEEKVNPPDQTTRNAPEKPAPLQDLTTDIPNGEVSTQPKVEANALAVALKEDADFNFVATASSNGHLRWFLFANENPVATSVYERATEGAKAVFDNQKAFSGAIQAALESANGDAEKTLADFGFEPVVVEVPVDEATNQHIEKQIEARASVYTSSKEETITKFRSCLSLASMAIRKHIGGHRSPMREKLVATLLDNGVRDAASVVDSVIDATNEDELKNFISLANEYMDKSPEAINELVEVVEKTPMSPTTFIEREEPENPAPISFNHIQASSRGYDAPANKVEAGDEHNSSIRGIVRRSLYSKRRFG